MQAAGDFYDGQTAGRHGVKVALSTDRQALIITGDALGQPVRWSLADLRALPDHGDDKTLILTRFALSDDESPRDTARLILRDPDMIDWLRRSRPNLNRRDVHAGTGRRVVRNIALAVAAVCLMLFVVLPALANQLARIIPLETEVRFGQTVTAQMEQLLGGDRIGALHCTAPAGRSALDKMVDRLMTDQQIDYDLKVQVFDHDMINAFAAPGGQVVMIRGLIDAAETPEEVAAVLAHEIGHVVHRDATRNALRTAGSAGLLAMVLGDIAGGTILVAVSDQMLNSAYSRDAERAADAYALERLNAANVDSDGFGTFFDRLSGMERSIELPGILATHPPTDTRAALAHENAQGQQGTTPILTEVEWQALRQICD